MPSLLVCWSLCGLPWIQCETHIEIFHVIVIESCFLILKVASLNCMFYAYVGVAVKGRPLAIAALKIMLERNAVNVHWLTSNESAQITKFPRKFFVAKLLLKSKHWWRWCPMMIHSVCSVSERLAKKILYLFSIAIDKFLSHF